MKAVAIVLAAGAGERMGGRKAFLEVGGRTILERAAAAAAGASEVEGLVVAVPEGEEARARVLLSDLGVPLEVVAGGPTRQASVRAALAAVPIEAEAVVCHDAARFLASSALFSAVVAALGDADGVIPVVPVPDTVKHVRGGVVRGTEPREELALAQTPQAFRAAALRDAHERALNETVEATDDAALLERAGYRVRAIPGDPGNFKVTTPEDLERAAAVIAGAGRG